MSSEISPGLLKFEHGGLAIRRARKLPEADRNRVISVVGEFHRVMAENTRVFESKQFSGARQVYTSVTALELIARLDRNEKVRVMAQQALNYQKEKGHEVDGEVFALCSSAPNKVIATDGSFTTAEDVGLRWQLKKLAEIKRGLMRYGPEKAKDAGVVFLGNVFSPGGKTTVEFNESLTSDAFLAMGQLNAELVKTEYPNVEKYTVVGGVSFGAVLALRMARFLPWDKTTVWAANPDPIYGDASPKKGNWLRMALGVATNMYDIVSRREHYMSKRNNSEEYLWVLKQRGIEAEDSQDQKALKANGLEIILKNIAQGADRITTRLYPPGVKVEWVQGAFDLSNQGMREVAAAMALWISHLRFVPKKDEVGKIVGWGIQDNLAPLGLGVRTDESGLVRQTKIRSGHPVDLHNLRKWARWTKCLS